MSRTATLGSHLTKMNGGDKEEKMNSSESRFLQSLKSLPMMHYVVDLYNRTKHAHVILETGCNAMENGVGSVMNRVMNVSGASRVDQYAGDKIEELKSNLTNLQIPAEKAVKRTKFRFIKKAQKRANNVLESRLGRLFMFGLDMIIRRSEAVVKYLNSDSKPVPARPENDGRPQDGAAGQIVPTALGPDLYRKQMEVMLGQGGPRSKLLILLSYAITLIVRGIKLLRQTLYKMSGRSLNRRKSHRKPKAVKMTPEKRAEIDSRRKISPKKRINSSFFNNVYSMTKKMLGFEQGSSKQTDIRDFIKCSKHRELNQSPAVGEEAEKRKHNTLSEDEDSCDSDDDYNLMYMDLDGYDSDNDPDYWPSEDDVQTDSFDSGEGTTESEIDVEEIPDSQNLIQIKDKNAITEKKTGEDGGKELTSWEKSKDEKRVKDNGDKERKQVNIQDPKDDKSRPSNKQENRKPSEDKQKSEDKSKQATIDAKKAEQKLKVSSPTKKGNEISNAYTDHGKKNAAPTCGKPVLYNGK